MTVVTQGWQHLNVQADGSPDARAALAGLSAELHWAWEQQGEPLDTHTLLARHPELTVDRWTLAHLALEEYRLRAKVGPPPDVQTFAERFEGCEDSVLFLVSAQYYFDAHPSMVDALPPLDTAAL